MKKIKKESDSPEKVKKRGTGGTQHKAISAKKADKGFGEWLAAENGHGIE